MKPLKLLSMIAIAAISLMGLASCNNDDPEPTRVPLMDFVTFKSGDLGTITLGLYTSVNGPEVTLTSSGTINEGTVSAGQRLVAVYYAPGDTLPRHNCNVELLSLVQAFNGQPKTINIADSAQWNNYPIYVNTLFRTGPYLNLSSMAQQGSFKDQQYGLWIDEKTLQTTTPEAYLVNLSAPSPMYSGSQFYASFDISSLVYASTAQKLLVHVADSNTGNYNKVFEFPLN